MQKTTVTCDACKEEIAPGAAVIHVTLSMREVDSRTGIANCGSIAVIQAAVEKIGLTDGRDRELCLDCACATWNATKGK